MRTSGGGVAKGQGTCFMNISVSSLAVTDAVHVTTLAVKGVRHCVPGGRCVRSLQPAGACMHMPIIHRTS